MCVPALPTSIAVLAVYRTNTAAAPLFEEEANQRALRFCRFHSHRIEYIYIASVGRVIGKGKATVLPI